MYMYLQLKLFAGALVDLAFRQLWAFGVTQALNEAPSVEALKRQAAQPERFH